MKKLLWVPVFILALGLFGCQDTSGPAAGGPIGANEMDDPPDQPGYYGDVTEAGSGDLLGSVDIAVWCTTCDTKIKEKNTDALGYYDATDPTAYNSHVNHTVEIRATLAGYENFVSGEELLCPTGPTRYDIEMVKE